jgi:DNA (cytosine-5)-methyltransferase 1
VGVLHGSPPCQPWSASGKGHGRLDARDGMPWMLAAVEALRPWLVTVENVEGLTYRKHADYLAWFCDSLAALGYTGEWRVLNAADYGVPQTRKRLIIVGRLEGAVCWPRTTHARAPVGDDELPWVSMADALGWPRLNGHTLHTNTDQRDGRRQTRSVDMPTPTITAKSGGQWVLQPGSFADGRAGGVGKHRVYVPDLEPAPTVALGKDVAGWVWRRPATTVSGDTRIHPPGHRANAASDGHKRAGPDAFRLSVQELAVLQDMPADYPFAGTKTSQVRQIGNALPPTMLQAVVGANLWPPRWPVA